MKKGTTISNNYTLCSTEESSVWDDLYSLLSNASRSPFFSSRYYRSYMSVESGKVDCFCGYQDDENFLFYPYIRKNINILGYELDDEYFDVSGAYGYNGPIGAVSDPSFAEKFNVELQKCFLQGNVVTEFVRYCPITNNRMFHNYTDQINVLDNVFIDLSRGLNWVWQDSFEYRVRKTIRKGEAYGLKTACYRGSEIDPECLEALYNIYNSTMQRNTADSFYYFDLKFFWSMVENLGDMVLLSITYYADAPISTELILIGPMLAFGFLGGTLSEFYQYKANTFQRWELLKYLDSIGIKKYSMGGGATRGDSIYDFKMSFAQGCNSPFYIGTKVHLPEVYTEIRSQWSAKHPRAAQMHNGKLQGYRIRD